MLRLIGREGIVLDLNMLQAKTHSGNNTEITAQLLEAALGRALYAERPMALPAVAAGRWGAAAQFPLPDPPGGSGAGDAELAQWQVLKAG